MELPAGRKHGECFTFFESEMLPLCKILKNSNWHEKFQIGVEKSKLAWKNPNWREKIQIGVKKFKLAWKNPNWREKIQISVKKFKLAWKNSNWREKIQIGVGNLFFRDSCGPP